MPSSHRWLRLAVAIATAAFLLALGWQCVSLYRLGTDPANLDANGVLLSPIFTRDAVAARLAPLLPLLPVYALLVIAAVMAGASPAAPLSPLTPENRLRLMKRRVAVLPDAARREERHQRVLRAGEAVAMALCAAGALAYLLNSAHFSSWDLEAAMGRMLLFVSPWALAAFTAEIGFSAALDRSRERETALLKSAPKTAPIAEKPPRPLPLLPLRLGILAAALAFIVLGVMNGGLRDVLVKAVQICTECIGLG